MLSKEDFKGYFDQIKEIEKTLMTCCESILREVQDDGVQSIVRDVLNNKKQHIDAVKNLHKFF